MELLEEAKLYERLRFEQDGKLKDDLDGLSIDKLNPLASKKEIFPKNNKSYKCKKRPPLCW